jgi:hypothetical protein
MGGLIPGSRARITVPVLLITDLTIFTDQSVTANELITAILAVSKLCTKRMRKLMIQSNYNMQRTGGSDQPRQRRGNFQPLKSSSANKRW